MTDPSDTSALRTAFGAFATGVTVVTTLQPDGTPRGFTANSFTSLSLDPPLVLVCIAKTAHSAATFTTAPQFAVNILAQDQKAVSGLFASKTADKFAHCGWHAGPGGLPLITGAMAQFTCAREQIVDAGDHVILIGRVLDFSTVDAAPLGYFRGRYFSVGMEEGLVQAAATAGALMVGAVLDQRGHILMQRGPDGGLRLPHVTGPAASRATLTDRLTAQGLQPRLDFLYAVFEDRPADRHAIYYHGDVTGPPPPGMVLVPLADLQNTAISLTTETQMLRRYADDYRYGTLSIYTGTESTGTVRRLHDTPFQEPT